MARTKGALNKDTITKGDNEDEFLKEVLAGYTKWKAKGEKEYAEAYQILLNKFSQIEKEK